MRAVRAVAPVSRSDSPRGSALTRPERLRKPDEFAAVFAARRSSRGEHLVFNVRTNGGRPARLGLAVSRRAARRAVRRNYMKRVLRELFRQRAEDLGGLDVVVSVASAFERGQRGTVDAEFARHTEFVQRWRASSSS